MRFRSEPPHPAFKSKFVELYFKRDHPFVPVVGDEHRLEGRGVVELLPGKYYIVGKVRDREAELLEMQVSRRLFDAVGRPVLVLDRVQRAEFCPNDGDIEKRTRGLAALPDLLKAAFELGYWAQLCEELGAADGRDKAAQQVVRLNRRLEDYGVTVRLRNPGEQ
ncbi:MAG: hypothetical protein AAFZ11_08235 [Pseudomonadota bacterium]